MNDTHRCRQGFSSLLGQPAQPTTVDTMAEFDRSMPTDVIRLSWNEAADIWVADVGLELSRDGEAIGPAGPAGVIHVAGDNVSLAFDTITGRLSFIAVAAAITPGDAELLSLVSDGAPPLANSHEDQVMHVRPLPNTLRQFLVARQFIRNWNSVLNDAQRLICYLSLADLAVRARNLVPVSWVQAALDDAIAAVKNGGVQSSSVAEAAGDERLAQLRMALAEMARRFANHPLLVAETKFLAGNLSLSLGAQAATVRAREASCDAADNTSMVRVERPQLDNAGTAVVGSSLVRAVTWTEPSTGWHRVQVQPGESVGLTDRLTVSGLNGNRPIAVAEAHGSPSNRVAMLACPPSTPLTAITIGDGPILLDEIDVTARITNANRRARLAWVARTLGEAYPSAVESSRQLFARAAIDWLAAGFSYRAGWCYAWSGQEEVEAALPANRWLLHCLAGVQYVMPRETPSSIEAWMLVIHPLELEAAVCG